MAKQPKQYSLRALFAHNTFLLIFSFVVALVVWFVMQRAEMENNMAIRDVPIDVQLSEAAAADGVQIFNMSYSTADLEISGSNLITNRLGAEDFTVTGTLNPLSTKLTGNTLQKATVLLRPSKRASTAEYSIVSVSPEEITVEYDRYKESDFNIEPRLVYSADTGFYPGTPSYSVTAVTVRGPESSVNKISRAAIVYTLSSALRADTTFSCPVRLYDQNDQEITDPVGLYLELDVDTVEVAIPILSRKTVSIVPTILHQPKGFPASRITVEPAAIDIAGSAEALSGVDEITLDTPIDFATMDVTNYESVTMDIPLPAGVRNINSVGDNTVTQATVSINFNDFQKVTVSVPSANFQVANRPADKELQFTTQQLDVTVCGSDAQTKRLTGDSLSVQMDLSNYGDQLGTVEVPATVAFAGTGSDSCWTLGSYTVTVLLAEPTPSSGDEEASAGAAASPTD